MIKRKNQIGIVFSLIIIQLLIVIFFIASDGNPHRPDSERYLVLAKELCADGRFFGPNARFRTGELTVTEPKESFSGKENLNSMAPEVFRTPGYPAFLCGLEKLGFDSDYSVVLVQYLLFLLTVFVIWKLSNKLYGEKLSFRLTVLMLLTPGGLVYSLTLYSEILFLLLFCLALLCSFMYAKNASSIVLLISAVAFAMSFYIKPSVLYLPFIIASLFIVLGRKTGSNSFTRLTLFLSIFLLGISPWLLRNYHHYQAPYISGQMSNMLAIYHLPSVRNETSGIGESDARHQIRKEVDKIILETEVSSKHYLDNVQIFNLQQDYALNELRQYPWVYLKLWVNGMYKTIKGDYSNRLYILLTGERIQWDSSSASNSPPDFGGVLAKAVVKLEHVFWITIVVMAATSITAGIWRLDPICFLSGIFIAYFIFIPGSMGYSRFRFPVEWLLLIHALQAWDVLTSYINHRRNHV